MSTKTVSGFFAVVWMVSWFMACWMNTGQLFFTGAFALLLSYLFYKAE